MSASSAWEYQSLVIKTAGVVRSGVIKVDAIDGKLAEFGSAGWELVAVVPVSDGSVGTARLLYTFKRPRAGGGRAG